MKDPPDAILSRITEQHLPLARRFSNSAPIPWTGAREESDRLTQLEDAVRQLLKGVRPFGKSRFQRKVLFADLARLEKLVNS